MIKDLTTKTSAELKLLVVRLQTQLMENRFQSAQGQLKKGHLIREMRKLIAQTLTVLHQRKQPMTNGDWLKYQKIFLQQKNDLANAAVDNKPTSQQPLIAESKDE